MIWNVKPTLEQLNRMNAKTIHNAIGIEFVAVGDDFLEATMPVDDRTRQPLGLLHGGASVVLAESLGSVASLLVAGLDRSCVGIDVHASHVQAMRDGRVIGRAEPIKLGQKVHFWRIQVRNERDGSLVCECQLTVMVKAPARRSAG